ncbi:MAG: OmpH family outer membrane protein [Sphingobacteriales bacterium]|nr:MAG: OmpH family outer membrane protein [Sphingobacteriales bacterium]TAF80300.1 MAG: OmpH family outer membrane protein [Sphingobacteriales bacterium]
MNFKFCFSKSFTVILLAAIAVGCKEQTKNTETSKTTKVTTDVTATIVYVNSDSLLNNYTYFKEIKAKFEAKSEKAQNDLKQKGAAFQREVGAYQQGASTMSAEQRAETEKRLARKQQELQGYQQNAGAALQNEEATENEKLYNKVAEYLKKHAKIKGYKMVLTYSKSNSALLFADESLDVTKEVIKGLNDEYIPSK